MENAINRNDISSKKDFEMDTKIKLYHEKYLTYVGMCILDLSKLLMYEFPMITLKIVMVRSQNY